MFCSRIREIRIAKKISQVELANQIGVTKQSVSNWENDKTKKCVEEKKKKMLIIPGFGMKCAKFFSRFVSDKFLLRTTYKIQKKKASD